MNCPPQHRHYEHGNMLFVIFMAVALIGLLTAVILNSNNTSGANIDNETLAIRASEVQRYATELERAVALILQKGYSETDIRFAHADSSSTYGDLSADSDTTDQVFARDGGGAFYRDPPASINDGSAWEFYGGTHIPNMGSSNAELIAVLPNVTSTFCDKINALVGQSATPEDTGSTASSGGSPGNCVYQGSNGQFTGTYATTPNTMDDTTFNQYTTPTGDTAAPAPQACVQCDINSAYHFYHVLLVR